MPDLMDSLLWLSIGKIIWIDILLSGDNALVIALACRELPARQRMWGMILGALGAILLRVSFTGIIGFLMEVPFLKLAGGAALLFIAIKLLVPEDEDNSDAAAPDKLLKAIGTIIIADITMSIDNVIAVAAAANGHFGLMAFGLALSIPLIVLGANLISGMLSKFPVLVWAGAALLGWIAGEVIATDPRIHPFVLEPYGLWACGVAGIIIVLAAGSIWRSMHQTAEAKG